MDWGHPKQGFMSSADRHLFEPGRYQTRSVSEDVAEAGNGGFCFEDFIILTDFRVAKAPRLGECARPE
jgi:hypothetical protein